jgi:hypothetical protein
MLWILVVVVVVAASPLPPFSIAMLLLSMILRVVAVGNDDVGGPTQWATAGVEWHLEQCIHLGVPICVDGPSLQMLLIGCWEGSEIDLLLYQRIVIVR